MAHIREALMPTKPRTIPRSRGRNATAVILEDIRAQNRAVIEAVQGLGAKIDRDVASLRAELIERIDRLEAAVRQNSRDIQKNSEDIRKNSEDIRKNSADIQKNS